MTKRLENMIEVGFITPTNVKTQAIDSTSKVVVMILRIDDVIAASKLDKETDILPQLNRLSRNQKYCEK
ncbi:MAG TPA: hypothetical protein ENI78_00120 [Euryarchaeota archaeon]|nr:hypothetical protein [Euryarchaeota archaeon]